MANVYGPRFGALKSNLVMYIDAALPISLPRSGDTAFGSTILDVSGDTTFSTATKTGSILNASPVKSDVTCLNFNGSNAQVRFDQGSTLTLRDGSWTVYLWIRASSSSSSGGLFSHWSGGPVNNGFEISGGKAAYRYYDGQWNQVVSSGATINTNTWVQLCYVRPVSSTANMNIYVNRNLDHTFAPRINWSATYNMGVLGSLWGNTYYNGDIGLLAIYHEAHTATQVEQMFEIYRRRYQQ